MDSQEQTRHTTVEHTTPLWRVLAVALAAGSITALGFYLQKVGHADDFATVLVVTGAYSIAFWARKRPDRLRARFGPFGKIADAIRESLDDIREYVHEQPMRVGVAIAVAYGVAIVIAKGAVVAVLGSIYSWELAVAAGCVIGAVAAAPQLFAQLGQRLSGPPDQPAQQDRDDQLPDADTDKRRSDEEEDDQWVL